MKYKVGQKLENKDYESVEIIEVHDRYYMIINQDDEAFAYSESEVKNFVLVTKEIPPDGTPVKILNNRNDGYIVRISSGEVDRDEDLECYLNAEFRGPVCGWPDSEWELLK